MFLPQTNVRLMIAEDVHILFDGCTALHYAVFWDRQDFVTLLIERGADIEAKDDVRLCRAELVNFLGLARFHTLAREIVRGSVSKLHQLTFPFSEWNNTVAYRGRPEEYAHDVISAQQGCQDCIKGNRALIRPCGVLPNIKQFTFSLFSCL